MMAILVVLFAITHPEILLDIVNETPENGVKTDFPLSDAKIGDGSAAILPTVQSSRVVIDGPSATSSHQSGFLSKMDVMVFTKKRVQSGKIFLF